MRLLLIEDSVRLRASLKDGLTASGFAIDAVGDATEGLAYARATAYDAIVLDLMLPGMDGLEMLRRFRAVGGQTPVLILSARDRVEQRVEALRTGADDYLTKPFSFDELLARIEALCRRVRGVVANTICIRGVTLNLAAKQFVMAGAGGADGGVVALPPREYAVLEYLFLNAGRVVSRAELEEHVYAADKQVWSNAVDSAIAAIRKKLGDAGCGGLIETRRGQGYLVPDRDGAQGAG